MTLARALSPPDDLKQVIDQDDKKIVSAYQALKILKSECEWTILFSDKSISLKSRNFLGRGGFKCIYPIQPNKVITIRNITGPDFVDLDMAQRWCEAIVEEKLMSDRLRNLGLLTLDHQILEIKIKSYSLPVLYSSSFSSLQTHGLQIRDTKNNYSCVGSSMLLGTLNNINPVFIKKLFEFILNDVACLVVNGISIGADSINTCIENTDQTAKIEDTGKLVLFSERHQRIRLFLFDFSSKHHRLDFNNNFNFETDCDKYINYYLDRAANSLTITSDEEDRLGKSMVLVYGEIVTAYESIKNELITEVKKKIALIKQYKKTSQTQFSFLNDNKRPILLEDQSSEDKYVKSYKRFCCCRRRN